MALSRDTYCSYCGTAYTAPLVYPRTCAHCATTVWANPLPVAVVIVPVVHGARTGLLVMRRAIPPRLGLLALPGGFLEAHETWQQGGVREVREETGVLIDAATLVPFWFTSTEPRPDRVLLFGVAAPVDHAALPAFVANAEVSARGLVFGPEGLDAICAFPLHVQAAEHWFASQGVGGPCDFQEV